MGKRGRERKAASVTKQVATVAAELKPMGAALRQCSRRDLERHPLQAEVAQVFMHQVLSGTGEGQPGGLSFPSICTCPAGRAESEARESLGKEYAGS